MSSNRLSTRSSLSLSCLPVLPVLPVVLAALFACGTGSAPAEPEPDGEACVIEEGDRFVPLRPGVIWTLDKEDVNGSMSETRVQRVGELTDIGDEKSGVLAYEVVTEKDTGQVTVWQEDTGETVVRHMQVDRAGGLHKNDVYTPYKGRLDESPDRLVEGASWSESYTATTTDVDTGEVTTEQREESWTVLRYGELVEVPAGTFCTMRISRERTVDGQGTTEKSYWYARGVGKVKERSLTNREILLDYSVPSP